MTNVTISDTAPQGRTRRDVVSGEDYKFLQLFAENVLRSTLEEGRRRGQASVPTVSCLWPRCVGHDSDFSLVLGGTGLIGEDFRLN